MPLDHIIKDLLTVLIQHWIEESHWSLTSRNTRPIDKRDHSPKRRRRRRRTREGLEPAVNASDIILCIERYVRVAAYLLRVVIPRGVIAGVVVLIVGFYGLGLV